VVADKFVKTGYEAFSYARDIHILMNNPMLAEEVGIVKEKFAEFLMNSNCSLHSDSDRSFAAGSGSIGFSATFSSTVSATLLFIL